MKVQQTTIPEVLIIEPQVFGDDRGFFLESWQRERYAAAGLPDTFIQDNVAVSRRGVLRGLHLQHPHAQGKLVQVLIGEVFDVAVDVRRGSPWFGRWVGVNLTAINHWQFWVPPGFAHGYYVLSETALFSYKCDAAYYPETEFSLLWNDPELAIAWPLIAAPQLSNKDQTALTLAETASERLPIYSTTE